MRGASLRYFESARSRGGWWAGNFLSREKGDRYKSIEQEV